ncbi:MAG: type II 3-dehydroquinate dehydratase [Caloramator sp.]|nr:type II 3-dehydroquinate dehydratase [Caloramator sp.]
MKVLIINGPNLNLLGRREVDLYGKLTYDELCKKISDFAKLHNVEVDFYQSNIEGEIINKIHSADGIYDGIIINPGAYTHYSYAIYDALRSIKIPAIEVHLTNIYSREDFRRKSVIAPACVGQISGFGYYSYIMAISYFTKGELL